MKIACLKKMRWGTEKPDLRVLQKMGISKSGTDPMAFHDTDPMAFQQHRALTKWPFTSADTDPMAFQQRVG